MPLVAVTSVKEGVTFSPPDTALSSVTVKVIESPSAALASATVTAAEGPGTVTVKVSVTAAFVPSSAEIVAVYSCTAASAATVPDTFSVEAS